MGKLFDIRGSWGSCTQCADGCVHVYPLFGGEHNIDQGANCPCAPTHHDDDGLYVGDDMWIHHPLPDKAANDG